MCTSERGRDAENPFYPCDAYTCSHPQPQCAVWSHLECSGGEEPAFPFSKYSRFGIAGIESLCLGKATGIWTWAETGTAAEVVPGEERHRLGFTKRKRRWSELMGDTLWRTTEIIQGDFVRDWIPV